MAKRKSEEKINKKIFDGKMPSNIEAEQSLLGCLLLDKEIQLDILTELTEEHFYSEANKLIFSALERINKEGGAIDIVSVIDALEKEGNLGAVGGITYLSSLTKSIPSTANYRQYFDIVNRERVLRNLIKSSTKIIEEAVASTDKSASLAYAEQLIAGVSEESDSSQVERLSSIVPKVIEEFNEISKDKDAKRGIFTGYYKLDKLTNGLHKTDLIILAARPGFGKTSLAMNIVENVALQGKTCLVFSLEMSREQLAKRMVCSVAEVSMEDANKGNLKKEQWKRLADAQSALDKANIFVDDSGVITPQEILSKCRRIKKKYGLDLVMVDYLQLMTTGKTSNSDNRQQEITEISRNLKLIAKEIDVPVLTLSQLSREVEKRQGKEPQVSDLRESGAIEQDADIILFIHRPDLAATEKEQKEGSVKHNVAQILIKKHRNGPQGSVELYFKGECTKFLNITEDLKDEIAQKDFEEKEKEKEEIEKKNDEFISEIRGEDELVGEDDIF